ncbi:hypothetical protein RF11_05146 [Thelohanellus kitauei]|uniref:Uncharacterized protein n=1 Tax=Thelohanellus kitauei TaxID=669202 RepID=A0A0C2MT35_THEKT|nr:hypothetical protein RF11_05146 [Thelohanellus kitauei]
MKFVLCEVHDSTRHVEFYLKSDKTTLRQGDTVTFSAVYHKENTGRKYEKSVYVPTIPRANERKSKEVKQFLSYFSYYVSSCTNNSITLANIDYMQLNNLSIEADIDGKVLPPIKINISEPYNFQGKFSYQINPRLEADNWTFQSMFTCNPHLQLCNVKSDMLALTRQTVFKYMDEVYSAWSPFNSLFGETVGIVLQRGDEVFYLDELGNMISIETCDTNGISLSHYPGVVYDFTVFVIDNFAVVEKILECSGVNNTCFLFKDNIFVSANFTYLRWKSELSGRIQIGFFLNFSSPNILETSENLRNESVNIDSMLYMNVTRIESQEDDNSTDTTADATNETNQPDGMANKEEIPSADKKSVIIS